MDNSAIADRLREHANHLEATEVNPHRVRAYRRAAETVLGLDESLCDLFARAGRAGLEVLPGVGSRLAYTLEGLATTGEFRVLGRAVQDEPERILAGLPGISPQLAQRIHDELGVDTLEGLEQAAHDGRLAGLGIGPKRLRGLRDALAGRFSRSRFPEPAPAEPTVDDLLAVDAAYHAANGPRRHAQRTPHCFQHPVDAGRRGYETTRHGWHFRALASNTALAHRLGQTHDWVEVYFSDGRASGQRTVVTETRGDLHGRRVVRGREEACRVYYGPALVSA